MRMERPPPVLSLETGGEGSAVTALRGPPGVAGYVSVASPVTDPDRRTHFQAIIRGQSPVPWASPGYCLGDPRMISGLDRCNRPRSSKPVTETPSELSPLPVRSWAVTSGRRTL